MEQVRARKDPALEKTRNTFLSIPYLLLNRFLKTLSFFSFQRSSLGATGGWTLENYSSILTDPTYGKVMLSTIVICTISMGVMLLLGIPLAYLLAMRMRPRLRIGSAVRFWWRQ